MPFLGFVELIAALIWLVVLGTQILWPALTGGKMFPFLRRQDLEHERREAEEALKRAQERRIIDELRDQAAVIIAEQNAHTGQGESK